MAQDDDLYDALYSEFRWHVPPVFNIAELCCSRWAREAPGRLAVLFEHEDGRQAQLTYGDLQARANRVSHLLERLGVGPGDRVAIVMPQRFETAIAHMAIYQLGAVAMPLSMLFGPEALEYRLQDSEACVAIADESSMANLRVARAACPALRHVIAVGAAAGQADLDWDAALARETSVYVGRATKADDPAVLIYTSGTTGPPKGALIPHRALIGNLPGFVASQNWFGFPPPSGPLSVGKGAPGMGVADAGPSAQSGGGHRVGWPPPRGGDRRVLGAERAPP